MININFKVTENEVTKINQVGDSTTGSIGQIKCTFDLDPIYSDLTCVAVFNEIKIPMIRGVCYADNIPEGRCVVGVYAYNETTEGTVYKRISPKPCVIVVDRGSYFEGHDPEPPTASETERFYNLINEAISSGQIKGEKGDKGDKGDRGEQGLQGDKGDPGKSGLMELKASISEQWVTNLTNHLYYTVDDVRLRAHNTQKIYLDLPQGTFLLVEKKTGVYGDIDLKITIWGSCTFNNVEYKYGIHQYKYNTVGGAIVNSFVLDTKSIETAIANLEANKQNKFTAGAGITITENGVISSDVGLKMVVLKDGEDLPNETNPPKNTIYFKRNTETDDESDDWYEEYIWVNNWWELIGTTKVDLSAKQDKLTAEQLENISAVPNKIDQSAVGNGLKFADGMLQLDIPVATASTTYGGDAQ